MPSKKQTTTQKTEPWAPAQGNLKFGIDELQNLYQSGQLAPAPYTGPDFGANATAAQQGIVDLANQQGAGFQQATDTVLGQAQGADNIYRDLDKVKQSALESVMPSVMGAFGGAGMTDSSVARQEAGTAAANAIAPIEYGAYNQAQNRSLQAAGMLPGMMQAQYLPQQMIGQVGAQQDAAARQRYYEEANRPSQAFNQFSNLALGYGGLGGTQSATQPGPSGLARLGGAGASGLGTYGALAAIPGIGAPLAIGGGLLAGLGAL